MSDIVTLIKAAVLAQDDEALRAAISEGERLAAKLGWHDGWLAGFADRERPIGAPKTPCPYDAREVAG